MFSSEDIRDTAKADLSSVPLELVDNVKHEDITVQETINISRVHPNQQSIM